MLGTAEPNKLLPPTDHIRVKTPVPSPLRPLFSPYESTDDDSTPAPSVNGVCNHPGCTKSVTRNGSVECGRCHRFICNNHGRYKAALAGNDFDVADGHHLLRLQPVCLGCFKQKPDMVAGTQVGSQDLTQAFKKIRAVSHDAVELRRNKIQMRFIRMVNGELLNDKQTYWEADDEVANCRVCGVTFLWWIRKHHCRLCGEIVCDDSEGMRKNCSLMVPTGLFVEKLTQLNYSDLVKKSLEEVISALGQFRCCVNCKNDLLVDWKRDRDNASDVANSAVLEEFDGFLLRKQHLQQMLLVYAKELSPKLSTRLTLAIKDLEAFALQFRKNFFDTTGERSIPKLGVNGQLAGNVYQAIVLVMQDSITEFRKLSLKYQEEEKQKLEQQRKCQRQLATQESGPQLTKKEIRELREQLMVMNEQKFLVEQMIKEHTKLRKFEELASLNDNKRELESIIDDLESRLGDFGF